MSRVEPIISSRRRYASGVWHFGRSAREAVPDMTSRSPLTTRNAPASRNVRAEGGDIVQQQYRLQQAAPCFCTTDLLVIPLLTSLSKLSICFAQLSMLVATTLTFVADCCSCSATQAVGFARALRLTCGRHCRRPESQETGNPQRSHKCGDIQGGRWRDSRLFQRPRTAAWPGRACHLERGPRPTVSLQLHPR